MPRGGKRRSRGRRRKPASASEQQPAANGQSSQSRRRRRRRRGAQSSALERMVAEGKTTTVQTLPPDGMVLDEVIAELRSEYGTPATPQEFRLLLKVPGAETEAIQTDPVDPQEEPAQPSSPEEVSSAPSSDVVETARLGPRRRRRGRRRGAKPNRQQDDPAPEQDSSVGEPAEPERDQLDDLFPPE
jgi:hypothetical protein